MTSSAIASMTGFARVQGGNDLYSWIWEVKSVNGRGLEIRFRGPQGFDSLEPDLRKRLKTRLQRGNVNISLSLKKLTPQSRVSVDEALLERLAGLCDRLCQDYDVAPPRADGLLALRGVLEVQEENEDEAIRQAMERALMDDFDQALDNLEQARLAEGQQMGELLKGHLERISQSVSAAEQLEVTRPEAMRARLSQLMHQLLDASGGELPEDRLSQEAALLVSKADVREELDRLKAHVSASRELLESGGAVGRRLDFLCQEFNREANTLCSKSPDPELTTLGLDLKATVDQLRELVQNIE
ncbi:MAG: YicC/YloC family endoribonuclease [Pseudomonadota bacterium]|uniref:YicC/YloC family endoribonuclease n=1 Tax=Fodinicurvata fenggangensis TaxID=1121830 RepID=UPI0005542DC6|nr:YicC/YloC family endoribonuclease [Fodinicurvata fenggangensis]